MGMGLAEKIPLLISKEIKVHTKKDTELPFIRPCYKLLLVLGC